MSSSGVIFKSVTYQRQSTPCLLQYANNNRNQERFNDVTIVSGNTSIPASRMVLCCYCSFFDRMLASPTSDHSTDACDDLSDVASQTNIQVNDSFIDVSNVDEKSLELVIQYIYTGQICIDSDNVLDILAAAHHLKVNELQQFCFEILENCITPDNCIAILITAKQYKNFDLRDKVYEHISDNYETITQTPAFLDLENSELFFIVYHLKTKFGINDTVLCRSLLSWTKQDEETRKEQFQKRLIKFVNPKQLSYSLLEDVLKENLIGEVTELYNLFNERMQVLKAKETKLLSIGGYHTQTRVTVVYSLEKETNKVYPDLPVELFNHASINVKNVVYCIGGDISKKASLNKILRLNLNEKDLKWEETLSMKYKRMRCSVAEFHGSIVVCGGHDGKQCLSLAECYNTELNKWSRISSMKQGVYGNQLTTSGGYLYTIGGHDGYKYFSSVERLDGLDKSWKFVSSMQTPRFLFAAVTCDDVIYAIGGWNKDHEAMKSVEKYDCAADKWSYVSKMNIERRYHSACVMQGRIFVVGGRNAQNKPVKEIECYDPSTDRWKIVSTIDDELACHSLVAL